MTPLPELNYHAPTKRPSKLAIVSVVLGAISVPADAAFFAGMPIALIGIILGVISIVKIRRNQNLSGKPLAIIGIALGGIALLLGTACGIMLSNTSFH